MNIKKTIFSLIKKTPKSIQGPIIRNGLHLDESKMGDIILKVAETKDELEQAYKLVHQVYLEEGYADDTPSKMRLKLINALPNTTTFVGKVGNQVITTMTLFEDSPLKLPMDELYNDELNKLRAQGRKFMEVGAFATLRAYRRSNQILPTSITKIMLTYAMKYLNMDDLLIIVNPKHVWVYENMFMFKKIGKLKYYKGVKNHPAVPLRVNLHTCFDESKKAYGNRPAKKNIHHYFFHTKSPFIKLPKLEKPLYIWSQEMLTYFFEEKTTIFRFAQEKHKNHIVAQHHLYRELSALSKTA